MDTDRIGRREVEQLLGLSRAAVRKLVDAGELRTVRDSRGVLWYSRAEVLNLKAIRDEQASVHVAETNSLFDLEGIRKRMTQEELVRKREQIHEEQRESHHKTIAHQASVERLLTRIANDLGRIRASNDEIEGQLTRLTWIALGHGALTSIPDDIRRHLWSGLRAAPEEPTPPPKPSQDDLVAKFQALLAHRQSRGE